MCLNCNDNLILACSGVTQAPLTCLNGLQLDCAPAVPLLLPPSLYPTIPLPPLLSRLLPQSPPLFPSCTLPPTTSFSPQLPTSFIICDASCLRSTGKGKPRQFASGAVFFIGPVKTDWWYFEQPDYSTIVNGRVKTDSNFKELAAAVYAIQHWNKSKSNVVVFTDNKFTMEVLNGKKTNRYLQDELDKIRKIVNIQAFYIPGKKNYFADKISRLHKNVKNVKQLKGLLLSHMPEPNNNVIFAKHMTAKSFSSLAVNICNVQLHEVKLPQLTDESAYSLKDITERLWEYINTEYNHTVGESLNDKMWTWITQNIYSKLNEVKHKKNWDEIQEFFSILSACE